MYLKLLVGFVTCLSLAVSTQAQMVLGLQKFVDGLSAPVALTHAGDGSNRVFVVEQHGTIRVIKDGKLKPYPFLDLRSKLAEISPYYSEMGLLGLAFHPNYKQNGLFYVHFSAPRNQQGIDHLSIIAEYQVSEFDADMADFTTQRIVMSIPQPASNHNGGTLAFGPDGYLYIGMGDGGGAGDRFGTLGNGQNLNSLLGKMLRIDVNRKPYGIPDDNPFVRGGGKAEIYAYGLRNPWKFSFAPDGRLFAADVGQNKYEEINLIEKGQNYGWRLMEGNQCYNPERNCEQGKQLVRPIYAYPHNSKQVCVVGGYVYRGKGIPALAGLYVFADWKGQVMTLEKAPEGWRMRPIRFRGELDFGYINSLGEDEAGNLYLLTQTELGPKNRTGVVYLLQR